MNSNKKKAYKVGLIAFAISFSFYELILVWHFLYLYYDELVGKNVFFEVVKLTTYMGGTLVVLAMPLVAITSGAIYYRYLFRHYKLPLKKVLRRSLPIAAALFFCTFFYSSFINPIMNLKALNLLYDIRNKKPDEPLKRTDITLFKNASQTQSIIEQYHSTDSMKKKLATARSRLIDMAKRTEDVELKYKYLTDSTLKVLEIDPKEIKRDKSLVNTKSLRYRVNHISVLGFEVLSYKYKVRNFRKALLDNFVWPLLAVVGCFAGLFLGVLSRRVHILVLILGINWGGGAIVFYINSITQKLLLSWGFGIYSATFYPFIVQLIFLWLLFRATKQSLKSWHKKPRLIPHIKPESD